MQIGRISHQPHFVDPVGGGRNRSPEPVGDGMCVNFGEDCCGGGGENEDIDPDIGV
jgi:hypothetical protein